jgi:hypothetical protein
MSVASTSSPGSIGNAIYVSQGSGASSSTNPGTSPVLFWPTPQAYTWDVSQEAFTSYGEALVTSATTDSTRFAFTKPGVYAVSWTTHYDSASTAAVSLRLQQAATNVYVGTSVTVGVGLLDKFLSNSAIIPIKLDEIAAGTNELYFCLEVENFTTGTTDVYETLVRIVRLGDNTAALTGMRE